MSKPYKRKWKSVSGKRNAGIYVLELDPNIKKRDQVEKYRVNIMFNKVRHTKVFTSQRSMTPLKDAQDWVRTKGWEEKDISSSQDKVEVKVEEIKNGKVKSQHTLKSFMYQYFSERTDWRDSTRRCVTNRLEGFFDNKILNLRMDEINKAEIKALILRRKKSYLNEPNRHNQRRDFRFELKHAKALFNYYQEEDDHGWVTPITKKHFEDGKIKKAKDLRQFLTPVELKEFLSRLETPFKELAIITVCYAMRIGESAALMWKDVDFDNDTITFGKTMNWVSNYLVKDDPVKPTKDSKVHFLKLHQYPKEVLLNIKPDNAKPTDFVFKRRGDGLHLRKIAEEFLKVLRLMGLKKGTDKNGKEVVEDKVKGCTHLLRKSSTNEIYDLFGGEAAQLAAGHSSLGTTEKHYRKISSGKVNSVHENWCEMFFDEGKNE